MRVLIDGGRCCGLGSNRTRPEAPIARLGLGIRRRRAHPHPLDSGASLGRDEESEWIGDQMLIDVHGSQPSEPHPHPPPSPPPNQPPRPSWAAAAAAAVEAEGPPRVRALSCHRVRPGGAAAASPASADTQQQPLPPPLSGHTATACGAAAWMMGGSSADGDICSTLRRVRPEVVRWVRPDAGPLQCKYMAGRSGRGAPRLFAELIGPSLEASTHTATRCGEYLYVLSGIQKSDTPVASATPRAAVGGGGSHRPRDRLRLTLLHLPSLSWQAADEDLHEFAPRLQCGHASAVVPALGGIAVYGGVRSDFVFGAGADARMSSQLHVLEIAPPRRRHGTRGERAGREAGERERGAPAASAAGASIAMEAVTTAAGDGMAATPSADLPFGDGMGATGAQCDGAPLDEIRGRPVRWAKQGGAFYCTDPTWPRPRAGHTTTALPGPYAWTDAGSAQGALLLFGGYTTDPFTPDGAEVRDAPPPTPTS